MQGVDRSSEDKPGDRDPSGNLRNRALGALGWASTILIADRAGQIVVLAILARLLTPEQTAVVAAAGLIVGMASLINSFGIPAALIQSRDHGEVQRQTARFALLLTALLTLLLIQGLAPLAGRWFRNSEVTTAVRIMVLIVITQPLALVANSRLTRQLRAKAIAFCELISNLGGALLVTVPLALMGFGWIALAIGSVAQVVIRTACLCYCAKESVRFLPDFKGALTLYKRGSGFLSNGFLNRFGTDAPRWIIGRYLPIGDLGLFSRANSLMNYPAGLFGSAADRVVFAAVALVQDQSERLKRGALDGIRLTSIVGLPLTVALVLLGPDIIRTILGDAWEGAVTPFMILGFATYMRLAERLNWTILRGTGRPYQLAALQLAALILALGGCLLGVRWGLAGVAAAVVGVSTFSYAATSILSMRVAGVGALEWAGAHLHGTACAALALAVLLPLTEGLHSVSQSPVVVLAISAVACGAAGLLASLVAPKLFLGALGVRMISLGRDMIRRRLS